MLNTSTAYASIPVLNEHDFLTDIPTVTSATRFSQHLSEAPVSMTVIDRATIQASGFQNIADLFRLVPGFQVAHVNTNKYAVTYHGHSDDFPRRLEVMIDGRSVYIPIISAVDWASLGISIDDIERIEVIRGSNTATHGSNAFLGAINIITRHPSTEPLLGASTTLGSLGTQKLNLRLSGINAIGHYRVSASHEKNDGSKMFGDDAKRHYFSFSGSFAPSLRDQVDVWFGVDQGHIKIGELKPARGLPENLFIPRRTYSSNYQHILWQHSLNKDTSMGLKIYRNELQLKEQRAHIPDLVKSGLTQPVAKILFDNNPNFRFLNEDGNTEKTDVEFLLNHDASLIRTSTGLALRHSHANSSTLFEHGNIRSTRYRVFNNAAISPSHHYTVNLGLMHEHEESGPNATSARAALNAHLNSRLTVRFGYSHSERLPSLLENHHSSTLHFNKTKGIIYDAIRRPSPTLRAEQIKSHEIGVLYNFESIPGSLDLRLFRERISGGIELYVLPFSDFQLRGSPNNPKTTTREGKNISTWINQGGEAQIKLKPADSVWLMLNYAYINHTKDEYFDGSRVIARNTLAPRHTASAMINWQPRGDMHLSASQYYVSDMNWFGGDRRDAYKRTDLRVANTWRANSNTETELAFVVQNVLGSSYKEFYDYHDFERRIFTQLRLKYR